MAQRINLYRLPTGWVAQFPDDARMRAVLGTDTAPTPYTAKALAEVVLAEIRRRNPGADVQVRTPDP